MQKKLFAKFFCWSCLFLSFQDFCKYFYQIFQCIHMPEPKKYSAKSPENLPAGFNIILGELASSFLNAFHTFLCGSRCRCRGWTTAAISPLCLFGDRSYHSTYPYNILELHWQVCNRAPRLVMCCHWKIWKRARFNKGLKGKADIASWIFNIEKRKRPQKFLLSLSNTEKDRRELTYSSWHETMPLQCTTDSFMLQRSSNSRLVCYRWSLTRCVIISL